MKSYKIVTFSMYLDDMDRIENLMNELHRRGQHLANRSWIVREAVKLVDIDKLEEVAIKTGVRR